MTAVGPAYQYRAAVVRVVDGDTLILDVDLGFHVWLRGQSFRLLGCNARELHDPGGVEARDNLRNLFDLPAFRDVTLRTVKVDKFGGRFDATIMLTGGTDLVGMLIADGWAVAWDGTGERPVPSWPRRPVP
jgi:micrococcal nuclease